MQKNAGYNFVCSGYVITFIITTSSFMTLKYGYKQKYINVVDWIRGIFVIVRVSKNITINVYEYKTALLPFMWA